MQATYKIIRDPNSLHGQLSSNLPSTDALNALDEWGKGARGREVIEKVDSDSELVVVLQWYDTDEYAGSALEYFIGLYGLQTEFVK